MFILFSTMFSDPMFLCLYTQYSGCASVPFYYFVSKQIIHFVGAAVITKYNCYSDRIVGS